MCIIAAAPMFQGIMATLGKTQAAGWLSSKIGVSAAVKAAAQKALMQKLLIGAGAAAGPLVGLKGAKEAKLEAAKSLKEAERRSASASDAATVRGPKIKATRRKKPGRSGLYI